MAEQITRQLTTAIVAPFEGLYSETFIRDHIARLPGTVVPVYGVGSAAKSDKGYICSQPVRLLQSSPRFPESMRTRATAAMHKALARFWRERRVDVVLAEYTTTASWLVPSCQLAGVPLVVHCHGYDVYRQETLDEYKADYDKVFQSAAAFIVVSRDMERRVASFGVPAERIHCNPCGVDINKFNPTRPDMNPSVIVSIGRFVEKKAPHLAILAFDLVRKQYPDATLTMVGEGPLLSACKQLVRALRIEEYVRFTGRQNPAQIAELLQGARAFVQHSTIAPDGDSEGSPVSVLEAGATSLPVIATAHAGIKDTVVHGVTGLLSPEYDVAAMSENLAAVLRDPAFAAELGRNGRARVAGQYSMDMSIAAIYRLLLQVVEPG